LNTPVVIGLKSRVNQIDAMQALFPDFNVEYLLDQEVNAALLVHANTVWQVHW
jgi:hypothetical protein